MVTFLSLKHLVDTDGLLTASVLILGAERVGAHLDLGRRPVETAEAHLSNRIELHAALTFDQV